jgi:hypothetical protein
MNQIQLLKRKFGMILFMWREFLGEEGASLTHTS